MIDSLLKRAFIPVFIIVLGYKLGHYVQILTDATPA